MGVACNSEDESVAAPDLHCAKIYLTPRKLNNLGFFHRHPVQEAIVYAVFQPSHGGESIRYFLPIQCARKNGTQARKKCTFFCLLNPTPEAHSSCVGALEASFGYQVIFDPAFNPDEDSISVFSFRLTQFF